MQWTLPTEIDFADCTLLKQSTVASTLLYQRGSDRLILRVPDTGGDPGPARAGLMLLQDQYNSYHRHARVLAIIERPAPAAVVEYIDGVLLREWLNERADRSIARALGAHFRSAHRVRRNATANEFLTHARGYAEHGRGLRNDAFEAISEELTDRLSHALGKITQMPKVWAHADPSLSNIFILSGEGPRFIDRHRDFDWLFTDLALVVFVALKSRAHPGLSGHLADFCATFLDAYGMPTWPSTQRHLAALFWGSVALYLAASGCVSLDADWQHGEALSADLMSASNRFLSTAELAKVLCP